MDKRQKGIVIFPFLFIAVLIFAVGFYIYRNYKIEKIPASPVSKTAVELKTFSMDGITFNYPSNWTDPEYGTSSFGQGGGIISDDGTKRITVLSGINKSHSKQELNGFLDLAVESGGKKLNIDGSQASINTISYEQTKITTIYLNAKDNKSQYSITFLVPATSTVQEINDVIDNVVISTLKFTN
jgi:hypothetical protein